MLIQKLGYVAFGAATAVLVQRYLDNKRVRDLRHATRADRRVVALLDWKRQHASAQ